MIPIYLLIAYKIANQSTVDTSKFDIILSHNSMNEFVTKPYISLFTHWPPGTSPNSCATL